MRLWAPLWTELTTLEPSKWDSVCVIGAHSWLNKCRDLSSFSQNSFIVPLVMWYKSALEWPGKVAECGRKGTCSRNGVKTVACRPDSNVVSVCNPDWPGTPCAAQARESRDRRCLTPLALLPPPTPWVLDHRASTTITSIEHFCSLWLFYIF